MTIEEATKIASLVDNDVSVICPLFRKCDDCAIKQQCGDDVIIVDPEQLMDAYNGQLDTRKDDNYIAYLLRLFERREARNGEETVPTTEPNKSVWSYTME